MGGTEYQLDEEIRLLRSEVACARDEIKRLQAKLKAKQRDVDDALAISRDLIRERDDLQAEIKRLKTSHPN